MEIQSDTQRKYKALQNGNTNARRHQKIHIIQYKRLIVSVMTDKKGRLGMWKRSDL